MKRVVGTAILVTFFVWIAACASRSVRCDGHLERINRSPMTSSAGGRP